MLEHVVHAYMTDQEPKLVHSAEQAEQIIIMTCQTTAVIWPAWELFTCTSPG